MCLCWQLPARTDCTCGSRVLRIRVSVSCCITSRSSTSSDLEAIGVTVAVAGWCQQQAAAAAAFSQQQQQLPPAAWSKAVQPPHRDRDGSVIRGGLPRPPGRADNRYSHVRSDWRNRHNRQWVPLIILTSDQYVDSEVPTLCTLVCCPGPQRIR